MDSDHAPSRAPSRTPSRAPSEHQPNRGFQPDQGLPLFDTELIDESARMWRAMTTTCMGAALIVLAPLLRAAFSGVKPAMAASSSGLPAIVELISIAIALFCAVQAIMAHASGNKRRLSLALRTGVVGYGILDLLAVINIGRLAQHDVGSAFSFDLLVALIGQIMLFTGTAAGSAERLLASPVDEQEQSGFLRALGYPRRIRPIGAIAASTLLTVAGFTATGSLEATYPRKVIEDYLAATRTGNDRDLLPFVDASIMLDGPGTSGIRMQAAPAGNWQIKSAERSGWVLSDSSTVDITLVNPKLDTIAGHYQLRRSSQGEHGWQITNPFATIDVQVPGILKDINVNGMWIPTFAGASSVPYRAAAGTYLVQTGYPQLFVADPIEVNVVNDRAEVALRPQLKQSSADLARNWGKFYLDTCLNKVQHPGDGAATNCPFEAPGAADLALPKNTTISGYRWTVDRYPVLEIQSDTSNGKAQYVIVPKEPGTIKGTAVGDNGRALKSFELRTTPFVGPLSLSLGTITVNFARK